MGHFGGPLDDRSPDALRAEITTCLAWLAEVGGACGLPPDAVGRLRERYGAPPAELTAHEPAVELQRLLDSRSAYERLVQLAPPAFIIENERRSVRSAVEDALRDGVEAWPARRTAWCDLGGGVAMRYASFWTGWELTVERARGPLSEEARQEAVDLGAALLEALDRPGWEDLRAQQLALLEAHGANLDVPPLEGRGEAAPAAPTAPLLERARASRRRCIEEYGFLPGFVETPFVLGRLAKLLAPPRAVELVPLDRHQDAEVDLSVALEVRAPEGRFVAGAHDSQKGGLGLPELGAADAEGAWTRPALERVLGRLLESPDVADVEVESAGRRLGVRRGRLLCEP